MADTLIRDVVQAVVIECAPTETVIVDGLLVLDDDEVVRRLQGRRQDRDDPLGYGAADVAVLVTPVLWLTLENVRNKLAEAAANGAARGTGTLLRRILRRKSPPRTVPPLRPGQKALVSEMVVAAVTAAGLGDDVAVRIAEGVVSRLALAEPDPGPATDPDTGGAPRP